MIDIPIINTKGNKVTYFGHSTFSLTTPSGQVALIDPFLTGNPVCPESLKKVPRLDVIFLSHAHSDHSADLLALAKQHKPKIVAIFETCLWVGSKGFEKETMPMGKGGTQQVGEFQVTMTHAFHSNSIHDGDKVIPAGEPAGLVIRMPGGFTIYHAGDTALFSDMKLIGELYKPDLAMLPIGDHFTMGPRDAAYAIRFLGVKHVIPMHYATFPFLTGTPEALRSDAKDIAGLKIHALKPGESL
jgi:L-ascorbate metabolism protein UlaG (beta-lactamase superfamily)